MTLASALVLRTFLISCLVVVSSASSPLCENGVCKTSVTVQHSTIVGPVPPIQTPLELNIAYPATLLQCMESSEVSTSGTHEISSACRAALNATIPSANQPQSLNVTERDNERDNDDMNVSSTECSVPCRKKLPVVHIINGALVRSQDYSTLIEQTVRRGFIVVSTDYSAIDFSFFGPAVQTLLDFIAQTIADGFDCPKNGVYTTASIINDVVDYFTSQESAGTLVAQYADLRRIILFGHSLGAATAGDAFFGLCEAPGQNFEDLAVQFRILLCEGYTTIESDGAQIEGLVLYEGEPAIVNQTIPEGKFVTLINSQFRNLSTFNTFREQITSSNGNLVSVALSDRVNHFGPNDFVTENPNQRPVCAQGRQPPEDAFTTDAETQSEAIGLIADLIYLSTLPRTHGTMNPLDSVVYQSDLVVEVLTE